MKKLSIVFLFLMCFASPVSASCAWMLWSNVTGFLGSSSQEQTFALDAYESKVECVSQMKVKEKEEEKRKELQDPTKEPIMVVVYTCLPDTVDPRARKVK